MKAADPVSPPSRLVVRAPNWLGDAVMALPAIAAVRRAFPDVSLTIAALASVAPVFEEETGARPDRVISLMRPAEESTTLASGDFDAALLLPNSFRSAWNARRAGIRERWGFEGNFRSPVLTRAVPRPSSSVHQSVYYLSLVRELGIPAEDALPRIAVRETTTRRAVELLSTHGVQSGAPVVGFAPGAAYGHAKRWPPDRVAALATRVWRERGAVSVLVGAGGDRDAGREIESTLPPDVRVLNLIGRTDLRLLSGVLAQCSAFVSNDSGAMHLAAAIGVPVAAIFGPTDDRVTAPLGDHDVLIHQVFCRPCMLRDCPIDHRCMKGITVDAVFDAVSARLGRAGDVAGSR
jgi:heptosyltransferase II